MRGIVSWIIPCCLIQQKQLTTCRCSAAGFISKQQQTHHHPTAARRVRRDSVRCQRLERQQPQRQSTTSASFLSGSAGSVTIRRMASSASETGTPAPRIPSVSKKIQQTLDPCVVLMKELIGQYESLWRDKGGIFSLAQGVVYWKPPTEASNAIQQALTADDSVLHLYGPDEGLLELREKLQGKLEQENGLHNQQVMITAGANQAYVNCVLTLLHGGDRCVVFRPYYFNHVMALQMYLDDSQSDLIVGDCSDDGIPDLDWLEGQLEQDPSIKLVTLVNPGNPTGTLLSREILQRAVDLCRQYHCWLVLDCTYEYFIPQERFDGCFDGEPHCIHIFSFSKAYALAGYRVGYIAISATAEGVYDQMMKVQDTIPICPSRIAQVAALGSLEASRDWVKENVRTLDVGREAILKALEPLEPIMGGSGAMYVMAKLPSGQEDDRGIATTLVRDFGVAVIPGSFCGQPGWIRVCYSNLPPAKCLEAADRLSAGIASITAGTDSS